MNSAPPAATGGRSQGRGGVVARGGAGQQRRSESWRLRSRTWPSFLPIPSLSVPPLQHEVPPWFLLNLPTGRPGRNIGPCLSTPENRPAPTIVMGQAGVGGLEGLAGLTLPLPFPTVCWGSCHRARPQCIPRPSGVPRASVPWKSCSERGARHMRPRRMPLFPLTGA